MEIFLFIGLGIVAALLLYVIVRLNTLGKAGKGENTFTLMNQNIQGMHKRLDDAAKAFSGLQGELGQVKELGRQVADFKEFMSSPKLRGNIGEAVLKDLLKEQLPRDRFEMQHKFKDGSVVDAIVKLDQYLIPIDAKFPLENFKKMLATKSEAEQVTLKKEFLKDVKKHIQSIAKKYILPEEGTVDFALMYVPSESVYYEVIVDTTEGVDEFAKKHKVNIVSPNTFNYFLNSVGAILQRFELAKAGRKILDALSGVQQEAIRLDKELSVLARHISNADGAMSSATGRFVKLQSKIDGAKLLKTEVGEEIAELEAEKEETLK